MKFLKALLGVLGLAGLVAGVVYLAWSAVDMREVMGAANANKSVPMASPINKIYLAVALAGVGGILAGLGLGLPALTRAGVRKQLLAESASLRQVPTEPRERTERSERTEHGHRVGVDPEPTQAELDRDEA